MAKGSLKKTVKDNENSIKIAQILIVSFTVIHLILKFWWYGSLTTKWSYVTTLFLVGVAGFIYRNFVSFSKVTRDENGELVSVRASLSDPGLIEYHWDILYINLLVMLLTPFSNYGWLPYLLVPGYAIYLAFSGLIIPWFLSGRDDDDGQGKGKKRDRSERRQKVQFVRR